MKWLKSMLSDASGNVDESKVITMLMAIAYIGAQLYALYKGGVFYPEKFGIGGGALAGGHAFLINQRNKGN